MAAARSAWDCSEVPDRIIDQILAGMQPGENLQSQADRAAAIAQAIAHASERDVVLIAGKGHEDYQETAGQRHPFSDMRSEEHTSELQSQSNLVCRLLLEKKNTNSHPGEIWRIRLGDADVGGRVPRSRALAQRYHAVDHCQRPARSVGHHDDAQNPPAPLR